MQNSSGIDVTPSLCPSTNTQLQLLGPFQNNISTLAQESLYSVQRLRIILTGLLASIEQDDNDDGGDESDRTDDNSSTVGNKGNSQKFGSIPSPACQPADGRISAVELRNSFSILKQNYKVQHRQLLLHKVVGQVVGIFEHLDNLAALMHDNRVTGRVGDYGLQSALSLFNAAEHLEFTRDTLPTGAQYTENEDDSQQMEMRRVDWLYDRLEADRWRYRYRERANTVLSGLCTSALLRCTHPSVDNNDRGLSIGKSRALEKVLIQCQLSYPKLTITLIEPVSTVAVVHIRVGEVMQCFVTLRRLDPERIIVRGISEPMIIKNMSSLALMDQEISEKKLSVPAEEMLAGKYDFALSSPQVKEILVYLLAPYPQSDSRTRRLGGSASNPNPKMLRTCYLNQHLLDFFTPSRHALFRRITDLAQCALIHFSNEFKSPAVMHGFFSWLQSYSDLFCAPCVRCGQLLGQNVDLPVWRSYHNNRKENQSSMNPQHECCQAA